MQNQFSTVEEALNHLVNGGYIILADDESRENEGDLVALGDNISADTVYEMLKEANGLMCVPVSEKIADRLGFRPMVKHSTDLNQTPFMVTADGSLSATGVSAFDRAATIRHIANPTAKATDFNHPGHIQPLYAQPRGLRDRTGHTEASVDLAYLAGKAPVAVIIEVLKDDGTMARRDDLAILAKRVQVPFITINQIIKYMDANGIDAAADLTKVNA